LKVRQQVIFIVGSIDPNNDSISYSFDWGDGTIESSGYLPNEIHCIKNHSWTQAGRYTITLKASDTKSSTSSETTIWIDTIIVGDKGYLLDFDCDGLFDIFRNGLTGLETETQMRDGNYLIDIDGDSSWDYQFNATSGVILLMLHQPPSSEEGSSPLLLISGLILVVLLGLFIILYRRRHHKQQ
jgi:PKD repeat protein